MSNRLMSLVGPGKPMRVKKEGRNSSKVSVHPPVEEGEDFLNIENIWRGVSLTWLMRAFNINRETAKKKLINCPPLRINNSNVAEYDFAEASAYLIKPKVNIAEYMKRMKPSDLPNELQKDYWEALTKKQRFEKQAGQLWLTEDVVAKLGDIFKMMKNQMQLWVEALEQQRGLLPEHRDMISRLVDSLQNDIYQELLEMEKRGTTPSSLERFYESEEGQTLGALTDVN